MRKKIISFLIVMSILASLFAPYAFAAASPLSMVLADEKIANDEYPTDIWKDIQIGSAYADISTPTGTGFSSNWLEKNEDGSFRAADTSGIQISRFKNASTRALRTIGVRVTVYRELAVPIVTDGADGVYTFGVVMKNTGTDVNDRDYFEYEIGDALSVGYTWNNEKNLATPYISVGGETIQSGSGVVIPGGITNVEPAVMKTEIAMQKNGDDTITLTVTTPDGSSASVTKTANLTGIIRHIGFDMKLMYIDDINVSYDAPERYMQIINLNQSSNPDEVEDAFKFLSEYKGESGAALISLLKTATAGNSGAVIKPDKITPAKGESFLTEYAQNTEEISVEFNFPLADGAQFSIYNKTSGDVTPVATATAVKNKVTFTTSELLENGTEYGIETDGTDFKGDAVGEVTFVTSPIMSLNVKEGIHFSEGSKLEWEADGAVVSAALKKGGEIIASTNDGSLETGYMLSECGEFTFDFTATKNGYTDILTDIAFVVDEDYAPTATNVKIEGLPETGETLTGDYDWADQNNGDRESGSEYAWYRITAEGETKIGDALTYTLTEADENADIIFKVTPKANSLGNPTGAEVSSEIFKGAYKPVITNPEVVKIKGTVQAGEYLEADAEGIVCEDINGDEIAEPAVKWYIADENGDIEITENIEDGKLKIAENVFNKYVYMKLIPVSTKKPYNGDGVRTEAVLMPSNPVVSNVRIESGDASNSVYIAYYRFTDINLDAEGETRFEWKDQNGNIIGNERKISADRLRGKTVTVTVTGVSGQLPTDSLPVTSAAVTIPQTAISAGSGGGFAGGGGGGYGYSGGTSGSGGGAAVTPVTPVVPEVPEVPQEPETETVFADVYGHWSKQYVDVLLEKEIVAKDESFRPDDSISRAEMLAMLFRSAGKVLSEYNGSYGDVKAEDWYAGYIQTALDSGIISPDDNFRPNDSITREEAAKIIAIMLGLKSNTQAEFPDADKISEWATGFVSAVYKSGIFKGDDEGNFNAKASLTRAETATVIYRLLNNNAFETEASDNEE